MKTTVINIYGAPGAGKSTLAAELYAVMSKKGESVELVREVAKEYAWTGKIPTVFEQIYITNAQMLKETALYGKVKYVITDSPLFLGDIYCRYYHGSNVLFKLNEKVYDLAAQKQLVEYPISLYLTVNEKLYKTEGRYSNIEEAKELDKRIYDNVEKMFPRSHKVLENPETRLEQALEVINNRALNINQ